MYRYAVFAGILSVVWLAAQPATPAFAITAKQRMVTCQFGAKYLKLAGKKRADFIKKCMMTTKKPRGPAARSPGMKPGQKS
jgi:hypothetical protein